MSAAGAALDTLQDAVTWADAALRGSGVAPLAPPQTVRAMPWSTVVRFATAAGAVYLKTTIPAFAAEARLLRHLEERGCSGVTRVIAANAGLRGFLTPDAGEPLRPQLARTWDAALAGQAVAACAALQVSLASDADVLLGLGLPDHRLSRLPGLFAALLDGGALTALDGTPPGEAADFHRLLPEIDRLCSALAAFGLPETLEHADFHDNNVLVRDGALTLADFGDAVVAHPFFSLASFLDSAGRNHAERLDPANRAAWRDQYLAAWTEQGAPADLRAAAALAGRLGAIKHAVSFARLADDVPAAALAPYRGHLTDTVRRFSLDGARPG